MGFIGETFSDGSAVSTSKSISFNGLNYKMEIGKNGYNCQPLKKSKWYTNSNIIFFLFAFDEIAFYLITGRAMLGFNYMYIFPIAYFIGFYIHFIIPKSKTLRMNHGAEHKILNAFRNDDLRNAVKYSRFSEMCGGNIYSMLFIFVTLSPIIKFPFTIFLIYMALYTHLKPVRFVFFNTTGKFTQYFTTEEPTEEILENTKKGFEKLLEIEVERMIIDMSRQKLSNAS